MDTSEMSIARCIKAVEIQALWKPANGDFCWHDNDGDDYMGQWEFPAEWTIVHIDNVRPQDWWLNWIWLPRQDQLQKMISESGEDQYYDLRSLWEWTREGPEGEDWQTQYSQQFKTMEQLWLAFVMKEKYNKVWDSGDWKVQTSKVQTSKVH